MVHFSDYRDSLRSLYHPLHRILSHYRHCSNQIQETLVWVLLSRGETLQRWCLAFWLAVADSCFLFPSGLPISSSFCSFVCFSLCDPNGNLATTDWHLTAGTSQKHLSIEDGRFWECPHLREDCLDPYPCTSPSDPSSYTQLRHLRAGLPESHELDWPLLIPLKS